MAPSKACSASILCGAVRYAGVAGSGASFRTFESVRAMTLDGSSNFVDPGIPPVRGAIKRPASAERKPVRALCPIHTMRSRKAVELRTPGLTDFQPDEPDAAGTGTTRRSG